MELSPNLTIVAKSFTDLISRQPVLVDIAKLVLLVVFLSFLLKLVIKLIGGFTNFKYKPLGNLFSEAERYFFLVLKQALSDEYEIFAKVRIADILTPDHALSRRNWNTAFYKISSKHCLASIIMADSYCLNQKSYYFLAVHLLTKSLVSRPTISACPVYLQYDHVSN